MQSCFGDGDTMFVVVVFVGFLLFLQVGHIMLCPDGIFVICNIIFRVAFATEDGAWGDGLRWWNVPSVSHLFLVKLGVDYICEC